MSYQSRSLGQFPQPGQEDLTIMDRLASALERLSSTQPSLAHREVFKAPDFTGEGNVEDFVQQFQKVAMDIEWSEMATLLHIRMHLKDDARECGNYATLEEAFEVFRVKYGLTVREARTRLTSLKRDARLSLTDQATEVKRLVEAAYADLLLDLFCNSLNQACLQRHLLAIRPQSLAEAVKVRNKYLQIKPNSSPGVTIRQVEEEEGHPETVQVTQSKPTEMETLLQALRQLTSEVASLKQAQRTSASKPKRKGPCWRCGDDGHLQ